MKFKLFLLIATLNFSFILLAADVKSIPVISHSTTPSDVNLPTQLSSIQTPDIFDVPGNMYELPENEDLLAQVKSDYGPIVDPKDYPELYAHLTEVFTDMSLAQGRLTEGAATTVNYVHIIDSTVLNAFVWTDNTTGVRLFSNHLFITTEMMRLMMDTDQISDGLLNVYGLIAGVLAHELGYPMDKTAIYEGEGGGISIENNYGVEGSQAIEIRADIDATRILREANYPVDCLLKSLERLFGKEPGRPSMMGAIASTHPHNDFRLSSARIFLTLDRLEKGLIQNPKVFKFDPIKSQKFTKEMHNIKQTKGRYPYKLPHSMQEIMTRIEAIKKDTELPQQFKKLEFNRLVLSFDRMLLRKQEQKQSLTVEEEALFKQFLTTVFDSLISSVWEGGIPLFSSSEVRTNINSKSGVSGINKSPSHYYYIEHVDAYKSEIVKQFLKEKADLSITRSRFSALWDFGLSLELAAAASVSDPDLFFGQFSKELKKQLQQLWINNASGKGKAESILSGFSNFHFRFQTHLVSMGHTLRENLRTAPFGLQLFFDSINESWSPLPIVTSINEKISNPLIKNYRQALVYLKSGKHPELQEFVNQYKQICQEVWRYRGFYGTTEMLFQYNMIDWPLVIEVLGLNKDVALNQIENEVQKYMLGERQYENVPPYATLVYVSNPNVKFNAKGKDSWLLWNSRNLSKLILGKVTPNAKNPNVAGITKFENPKQQLFANLYKRVYITKEKKYFDPAYRALLRQSLTKSLEINNSDFIYSLAVAHLNFFPNSSYNSEIKEWDEQYFLKVQLDLLKESTLSQSPEINLKEKQLWFEHLFFNAASFGIKQQKWQSFYSHIHNTEDVVGIDYMNKPSVYKKILEVQKLIYGTSTLDFFFKLKAYALKTELEDTPFYRAMDTAEKELQIAFKEESIKNYADLIRVISLLKPMEHRKAIYEQGLKDNGYTEIEYLSDSKSVQVNSARIQRLKKTLLDRSHELSLTYEQKLQIFLDLTESGPTKETDQLFLSLIDPKQMNAELKPKVLGWLDEGRFTSDALKLDLAKIFIGGRVDRLKATVIEKGNTVDRYSMTKLIRDLHTYAPNGSIAKDEFIEKIGMSLRLHGSELDGFIEDQKSQNWRKANPLLIRVGSLMAVQFSNMSMEGRFNMIEYLLDPVNKETKLFDDIMEELKKISYHDLLRKAGGLMTPKRQNELKIQANRIAEVLKLKAEEAIRDSAPLERLPLFEVILTAGAEAPIKKKDWPYNITRKFLQNYEEGSLRESILRAWLKTNNIHEHSVAIAYMLATSNEVGGVSKLFDLHGAVGKKMAQWSSIFDVFGEMVSKDLKKAKSEGKALSRYETFRLGNARHHEFRVLVKEIEKVLGAGSIKTTDRVRFADGSLGAMGIQDEFVKQLTVMNLEMGLKFLEALKEENVIKNSKFLMNMVEALGEQVIPELDMVAEAKKTLLGAKLLSKVAADLGSELGEWTLEVPKPLPGKPLTENLAFYKLATGVTYDKLSPEEQEAVGPIIAKAKLKMFFQYGWFNPDCHHGNIMVDVEKKIIYFIDWGQLEDFSKSINPMVLDPRVIVGQFIKAVTEFDAPNVIYYAHLMARIGGDHLINEQQLEKGLRKIFAAAKALPKDQFNLKDLLVDVITEISENDLKFETRYIFGGLKGLMILFGEKYVSNAEFEKIMRQELKSLFIMKSPALILEKVKSWTNPKQPGGNRCEQALTSGKKK